MGCWFELSPLWCIVKALYMGILYQLAPVRIGSSGCAARSRNLVSRKYKTLTHIEAILEILNAPGKPHGLASVTMSYGEECI